MITKRQLALLVAPPAALALAVGLFGAGQLIGRSTYDARSVAYTAGYDMARSEFCNLKLEAGKATALDSRRIPGLDEHLLAADASCEDWQLLAWNAAQQRQGSDRRACRFDEREALVADRLDVVPCITPVDLG
ncbi:hypothetical protein ACWKWP_01285 [Agromyces soli]